MEGRDKAQFDDIIREEVCQKHHTSRKLDMGKISNGFQGYCESLLIENFKLSPHLKVWRFNSQTLLWTASGLGLEQGGLKRVWELNLQTIKWGLILKLPKKAFSWQS